MTEITQLDATTVERIAAGEVVERPASVVKELVENSLDADASRVDVEVTGNGTDRIAVADDGVGMTADDVRAAVRKHTTSKISGIDDLESGVATLGFRGEALHTIGAVSQTTIRTKPRGEDAVAGTELKLAGGSVEDVERAGCPEGTTIEVTDLFYNTPAREKYLKADATEFAHVNNVVTQYALANPDIAVSLSHDDREVFSTTGQGDLESTVLSVYGAEVAKSMVEVDAPGDGPLERIHGYVSDPETTRSTREYVSTYVNGRYVTAKAVREAVVEAYGHQLASNRYPFAVLFLDVDPATVDVNVHPRKMEVRFGDEAGVRAQVEDAVESALLSHGLVRSSAPRGRSAPEEASVTPGEQSSFDEPAETTSQLSSDTDADVVRDLESSNETADSFEGQSLPDDGTASPPTDAGRSERKFQAEPEPTTLDDGDAFDVSLELLPEMRVLGQLHDTYVVAETPDGMVLVDQHAADERVNYEYLQEQLTGEIDAQMLASPVELEVTASEAALFDEYEAALASLGFYANRVDDRVVAVETVPAVFDDALDPSLLRDVLAAFVQGDTDGSTIDARADELLADLACYPSITGNTSLTEGSVVELLDALDQCENPYACPHGRPVVISFDESEIEDRFERDYPGHAH